MMRMRTKTPPPAAAGGGGGPGAAGGGGGGGGGEAGSEWEVRPGGMLVQKRNPDSDRSSGPPPPTIRVRVKYGSNYHEINISAQATFGELKKRLAGATGLHHQDQKLYYKDKERDSSAFLDMSGVKDKSKVVLVEDPISQEKRLLEMRKNAKMEKASKSISEISLEVDRLAGQVSAYETVISKGAKVAEKDVLRLIELLMNQLLRLDSIMADGDAKLQRKMQVKRVQKYVETLDMIKAKNSMSIPNGNGVHKQAQQNQQKQSHFVQKLAPILEQQAQQSHSNGLKVQSPVVEMQPRRSVGHVPILQQQLQQQEKQQPSGHSTPGSVVVTTQWETFDSTPPLLMPVPTTSTSTYPTNHQAHKPEFPWDFYG